MKPKKDNTLIIPQKSIRTPKDRAKLMADMKALDASKPWGAADDETYEKLADLVAVNNWKMKGGKFFPDTPAWVLRIAQRSNQ